MSLKNISTLVLVAVATVSTGCATTPETVPADPDALSGATPAHHQSGELILPPPSDMYEVVGVTEGLESFVVKYDDRLFRGGEIISEAAADSLRELGVRTVVSVTPSDAERAYLKENGFELLELPFGMESGIERAELVRFLDLFDGDAPPVFVHCHGGTHRAGALGVAYRVHVLGWDWDKAILEFGLLGGSLKDDQGLLQSVLRDEP